MSRMRQILCVPLAVGVALTVGCDDKPDTGDTAATGIGGATNADAAADVDDETDAATARFEEILRRLASAAMAPPPSSGAISTPRSDPGVNIGPKS